MQQIMERQKVVDEYRSMMVDRMDLTPLESNSYNSDLVVISHIIHMIEVDNFWHHKTFEAVLASLQRIQDEEIHEQENKVLHCTENDKTNRKMGEKEVINLCSTVRLQPVKCAMKKKPGNKKVATQRRAKQLQGWKVKKA